MTKIKGNDRVNQFGYLYPNEFHDKVSLQKAQREVEEWLAREEPTRQNFMPVFVIISILAGISLYFFSADKPMEKSVPVELASEKPVLNTPTPILEAWK